MGRIIATVNIENASDVSKSVSCDALVDSCASLMILPAAWKQRVGRLQSTRTVELETATQEILTGEVCGPVRIQIDGFRPIFSEVAFAEMSLEGEEYVPLLGHIVLAQSQARIDVLGHRLVPIKHMDLKCLQYGP